MVKNYALIKNGIVLGIAVAGENYTNPLYDLTIEIDSLVQKPGPGWSYSNGVFTAPPPTPPPPQQTVFSKFVY